MHFGKCLLLLEFVKQTEGAAAWWGPVCETCTIQYGTRDPCWVCPAQGTHKGGAANCCWEPWQQMGRDIASAVWLVGRRAFLCPCKTAPKSSPFNPERKVRRWYRMIRKRWLQQGMCAPGVSEKGSALAACQWRWVLFRKGWFWGTEALLRKHARLTLLTSQTVPNKLLGSLSRLPAVLLTPSGYLSSSQLVFLVLGCGAVCILGLIKLPMTSHHPAGGLWAALAPSPLWGLGCHPLSATILTCSCVHVNVCDTLSLGFFEGEFSKNSHPRENSHFWLLFHAWNK